MKIDGQAQILQIYLSNKTESIFNLYLSSLRVKNARRENKKMTGSKGTCAETSSRLLAGRHCIHQQDGVPRKAF